MFKTKQNQQLHFFPLLSPAVDFKPRAYTCGAQTLQGLTVPNNLTWPQVIRNNLKPSPSPYCQFYLKNKGGGELFQCLIMNFV